ncbi:MAG: glutathione S-transferase family protein [Pseudomonadota bacterium]|nr:glutathione S-transferase family protein [Pseudomonadota bacterium]MEC7831332.1 glutathione S-transferase family protein [Pseudomonadota bacterium]MEC9414681.1 glutathione S-transferase family protein [Pseudomonadota bacterium]MEC9481513.1 glutathione S-transferase family protein [Pseudomonadota bacterium]
MILYEFAPAPNPRRVRIFLSEKGIDIETRQIDLMKGEHKKDDYKRMSPLSQVPTLELDDGTYITESIAICHYFEALQPEPNLLGNDPKEIAIIEMWQRRIELLLMLGIANTYRHGHPAMAALEDQVKEWSEASRPRVVKMLHWFDKQMEGKEYMCLDRYTIADISALVCFDFAKWPQIDIPDDCKNLKDYYERLNSRPSASA